ncbi:MAG: gliding motility-associated C-terminal domain-containing protein [Bacteroidota bacterium]
MKYSTLIFRQFLNMSRLTSIMSLLLFTLVISNTAFSQISVTFSYTGSAQYWTVPPCVDTVTIVVAGAKGGGSTSNFGAVITYQLPVTTGQIFQLNVGGQGVGSVGGWNGGGNGWSGAPTSNLPSGGGGGASDVRVAPYAIGNRIIVAGGGGGTNASSASNIAVGGSGGCPNGSIGAGSPFTIVGGGGGTQTSGGAGGPFWSGGGFTGSPGSLAQGGNGGHDPLYGTSGGGGGGGYYGGGGGGTDGCCIGSNGGGAGGGGSSLMPAGSTCAGSNAGNGYITISSGGIVASNTGPYCEGSTIQLQATGGATTYAWTGPNGFLSNLQNPTIPNSIVANGGTYSVTVTGVGCTASPTTTVSVTPGIFPNAGVDDTVCFGSPFQLTGTITVATDPVIWTFIAPTITPTPVVTYAPAANNLTPMVNASKPGPYRFILQEGNAVCGIRRDTVNIFVKQMDIQVSHTNPICFGSSDGTITATGTGAVEYSYDNGVTWSSTSGTGFASGIYDVCVRDVNQCQACTQDTLVDPLEIVISVSNDTLICENGTATLFASAINGISYTYNWAQFSTNGDTQYGMPSVDTYYYVEAVSSQGCVSNMDSIYVTVRPPITGTISADATICPGYPTTLNATAQDGFGVPYTFTWSSGDVGSGAQYGPTVSPPVTQVYTVTITDDCESTPFVLSNTVTVAPEPVPSFTVDVNELCEPAVFTLNTTTDTSTYEIASWLISDGQFYTGQDTVVTNEMPFGSYNVELILLNEFGCIDSVTYPSYLISHALPKAAFKFSPGQPTMFNTQVTFDNYSIGADQFQWSFELGDPNGSTQEDPIVVFPDGYTAQYHVNLIVTSDFGCKDTVDGIVEVFPEVLLFAPNSFTPDGDEFNPTWSVHIEGIDVYDFNLEVLNRWGQLIWQSKDVNGSWDGTFNNQLVQSGVYTWTIRAKDSATDKPYTFKGNVNVIR